MERQINYLQALREALGLEMRRDPSVVYLGEDVRHSFRGISRGFHEEFGSDRIWDTPISESAFVGLATGAAIAGLRPVVEFQINTLVYVAFEQMVNQAQKLRYMMGGQGRIPVTYLVPGSGARPGLAGQHSDHAYPFLLHGGMKVVMPANPHDAKGLFTAAIREDDPVVVFAPAASMSMKGPVPEEEVLIPLGKGEIKKSGSDLTVLAVGPLVPEALKIAQQLEPQGISVEVLDARSLLPFDHALLESSVNKTGRLVIFDDSNRTCGFAAEIAAYASEHLFYFLKAPIARITRADVPVPFSTVLDKRVLPRAEELEQAIRQLIGANRLEPVPSNRK
ncbi:MAG: alpha-ketoacid dehydrogenase subunit beta [Acidobacteria bacterium]|nr:alpha-ketoacid dehydrogenase subunit beta [Acidobacteriota bacterium]MCI0721894.1 alpha-ketoacid dehydrogenase subunit beta [Acidobacteriota bacterium]